jgi:hypothetical protein
MTEKRAKLILKHMKNKTGLYLKNALKKGNRGGDYLTSNQFDLKEILTQIWNNQDNLRNEDIKILEQLAKK